MRARAHPPPWRKHLDGWQAGAVLLLMAGSAIVLAVPRGVAPEALPRPDIDHAALARIEAEDSARTEWARTEWARTEWARTERARTERARTERAASEPLDVDVRALGQALRAYNRIAHGGSDAELFEARGRVTAAAHKAIAQGAEPVLVLRAYQTARFVEEVGRWTHEGMASDELIELSGDFLTTARRSRWCSPRDHRLVMTEAVLRVLFKKRWNDVTALDDGHFALSLDEDRLRYAFLLDHPHARAAGLPWPHDDTRVAATQRHRSRLTLIGRLVERDPDYPAELARGVVKFWMGQYELAAEHFRRHLESRPDGPYTLRAQNYLKEALGRSSE